MGAGVRKHLLVLARREAGPLLHLADTEDQALVAVRLLVNESRRDTGLDGVEADISVVLVLRDRVRVHLVQDAAEDVVTLEGCLLAVTGQNPDVLAREPNLLGELAIVLRVLDEPVAVFDARLDVTKDDLEGLVLRGRHLHERDARAWQQVEVVLRVLEADDPMDHVRQRNRRQRSLADTNAACDHRLFVVGDALAVDLVAEDLLHRSTDAGADLGVDVEIARTEELLDRRRPLLELRVIPEPARFRCKRCHVSGDGGVSTGAHQSSTSATVTT